MNIELTARPEKLSCIALRSPLPEPSNTISMKMPHATEKPVRKVRSLLRLTVENIS